MIISNGRISKDTTHAYKTKVALLADMHIGYASWGDYASIETMYRNINKKQADFCLMLGDQIDSGYKGNALMEEQSEIFYDKVKGLACPKFVMQGNHDTGMDEFTRLGVVEHNGVRFICFDAKYRGLPAAEGEYNSTGEVSEKTLEFIGNELEKGDGKINILCCHYSIAGTDGFIWSLGDAQQDADGVAFDGHRDDIISLCSQYGVRLYLNGHEHKKNLIRAVVDGTDMTNVQIGTATQVYVILTVYEDKFLLEEYDTLTDELTNTAEIPI